MTYRYAFDGAGDEDFPEPPIARTLTPGDEVETEAPVEHPRLRLVESTDEPSAEKVATPDKVEIATPDLAPLVGPDMTSTPVAPVAAEEPATA